MTLSPTTAALATSSRVNARRWRAVIIDYLLGDPSTWAEIAQHAQAAADHHAGTDRGEVFAQLADLAAALGEADIDDGLDAAPLLAPATDGDPQSGARP